MPNHYTRDLSILVPDGGGFRSPRFARAAGDYTIAGLVMVSDKGHRTLRMFSGLYDEMRETFAALESVMGECPHGEPIEELIESDVLKWSINDYVCCPAGDRENVAWNLWGMHEDGAWCFAREYYRGVVFPYGEGWNTNLLPLTADWNVVVLPNA